MTTPLRSPCACTSAVLIRKGVLSCASCGACITAPSSSGTTYSTLPGEWPDGCRSRRQARDRLRRVPGVEVVGGGRGTIWRVERAAYARFYARKRIVPTPAATSTDEQIAQDAIEAAGMRPTRSA